VPAKQQIINVLPIQVAKQNELSANGTGKGAKTPQHAQKLQQSERASERAQIKTRMQGCWRRPRSLMNKNWRHSKLQAALMTARES
jgi:hypothetical protein